MARKYARDNRGRFASTGSGVTARGGRLKTASGNKRQGQTMQAKGGRAGTIGKPKGLKPGALKPKPANSPASKPKFEKVAQGADRQTAALPSGRRINIHNNDKAGFSAALIAKNGTPRMERSGFRNVSAAKAWAANPNARGPRLMGGALRTETTAKSTWTRTSRPKGTVAKPKGLKPGAIQARAAAKPAAKPAAKYGRGVDVAKVGRIMQRVQANRSYQGATSRVQNAKAAAGRKTQQRAADFLHKQAGFKKAGTSMGRTRWESPAGLTKEQAMRNIAQKLPKQPRRSTAKTGNRKIATRADKRQQALATQDALKRSAFFERTKSSKPAFSLRQNYDPTTGRGKKATAGAAKRQTTRREVVRKLRGLGPYNSSKIRRGAARQATLAGGTRSTFGRFRPVR